jgi:hypothetical protein
VLAVGGYGDLPLMEDYALFARMLQNGARAVNVAEPLVYYRVGESSFKRRGGTDLLRSELRLQREFRRQGFTSSPEYVRNVVVRGGYRMIPWRFRRAVYRPIVAHYTERGEHGEQQQPGGEAAGSEPEPAAPARPGRDEPGSTARPHEPGSTTKPYEPGSQTKPLPVRW